jgi:hypothetical protein
LLEITDYFSGNYLWKVLIGNRQLTIPNGNAIIYKIQHLWELKNDNNAEQLSESKNTAGVST